MSSRAASDPATILRTTAASSVGSPRPFITVYVSSASSVSPFARSPALWPLERPRREVGFEARYPMTADRGVMGGPGRELEAVALAEIDRFGGRRKPETDRAPLHHDHLVVAVSVPRGPIAGSLRPGPLIEAIVAQPLPEGVRHLVTPRRRRR